MKDPRFSRRVEDSFGTVRYYSKGVLHREDGPAIVYPNGNKWYYINDCLMEEQEFMEWKIKNFLK